MQINLLGPMRLTRRLTPAMAEKGEGYHINISSSAGKHPSPKQCAYAAAKWGMTGFALSSAKVCALCPHRSCRAVPCMRQLPHTAYAFTEHYYACPL